MKIHLFYSLLFFGTFFLSEKTHAYPELARNGYVNCQSCHISPNGAGILNDYGREISKELLAMWKSPSETDREHQSVYGVMADTPIEKWLKISGDTRSLYLYRNDPIAQSGRTLLMQAQLEAAIEAGQGAGHFTIVGSLDYQEEKEFYSRRHYLLYALKEGMQLRAGKFTPAYGLNTADHIHLTRSGIRLGPMYESYNAEFSYYPGEQWEVFGTAIIGRPEDDGLLSESGFSVHGAYLLNESIKLGLNALRGSDSSRNRWLYGAYGMVGITPWLTGMSEVDFQETDSAGLKRRGVFTTQKLSAEIAPGLWGSLLQEYGQSNFNSSASQTQVYGVGMQFFPRTHFELNLTWEKVKIHSFSADFYDYMWFVAHFYL